MSNLREKVVTLKSLGRDVLLRELNARGHSQLMKAHRDGDLIEASAITAKFGNPEWADKTVEEIMDEYPLRVIREVSEAVLDLSETDEKN